MIEPIKYFMEHQEIFGVVGSVFSGGVLYYMIVMAAKIVRIEENLKSRGTFLKKIDKIEENLHQMNKSLSEFIATDRILGERIESISKRVDRVEVDIELLKNKSYKG